MPYCCFFSTSAAYAQDAIDLSAAVVWNSPADVASWPRTTKIAQLTMLPENSAAPGLSFEFPARATWPDYTPPGFEGPIQYTVWAGVNISGVWHVSGIIRMWRDRAATGAPILTNNNFARNWVYDSRWGAMQGYQPVAGEAMIFFVTAGNARGTTTVTSVRERSNVVLVNLPANDHGVFRFPAHQTDLLSDFGIEGLWVLTDATTFSKITAANPKNVVAGDLDGNGGDEVIADFGAGHGIWILWNNSTWHQLHSLTADSMVTADVDRSGRLELIIAFPEIGTWVFANGMSWWKLNDQSAARMLVTNIDGAGQDLMLDFPGTGLWILRNGSMWVHLHWTSPSAMAAGDFDGNGVGDVVFAFPGLGVWLFVNGLDFVKLHDYDPVHLAVGDVDGNGLSDLVVDFGPGVGVWLLANSAAWGQLHTQTTQQVVLGDLDGNGQDDIISNFSTAGGGVWVLANLRSWVHAHSTAPEQMVVASLN